MISIIFDSYQVISGVNFVLIIHCVTEVVIDCENMVFTITATSPAYYNEIFAISFSFKNKGNIYRYKVDKMIFVFYLFQYFL